jgi:hypothetical protein
MLSATLAAVNCLEALELSDRPAALSNLEALREAIRALESIDRSVPEEISRLRWQEAKLSAAIDAKTDWGDVV